MAQRTGRKTARAAGSRSGPGGRFVVHEHHARRLHYDLRLEMAGVLKSWAVPKGPSMNPEDRRLALLVEDHPLEYADFEGIIPSGSYGAGAVVVWDRGRYDLEDADDPAAALRRGRMTFRMQGRKLKGTFSLVRLRRGRKGNEWLWIKKADRFADAGWTLVQALTPAKRGRLRERVPPCEVS